MLEFNLASEKVILFSARAQQVKTLVDDFILELKKVRVLPQSPPGVEAQDRLCTPTGHPAREQRVCGQWPRRRLPQMAFHRWPSTDAFCLCCSSARRLL